MIGLVTGLKKDYIIGCITNSIKSHTEFNKKRNLYKHFSPCIISDEVGLRKPDKEIFRLYFKEANCQPRESIFIDDEAPMHASHKWQDRDAVYDEGVTGCHGRQVVAAQQDSRKE